MAFSATVPTATHSPMTNSASMLTSCRIADCRRARPLYYSARGVLPRVNTMGCEGPWAHYAARAGLVLRPTLTPLRAP